MTLQKINNKLYLRYGKNYIKITRILFVRK